MLTHVAFGFTVAPFIILGLKDSLTVWARVYFYCPIGVALCFALFSRSLPFRRKLQKMQERRVASPKAIEKVVKEEKMKERADQKEPVLGLPEDPEAEVDEIVREVRREIEERRRRGSLKGSVDIRKLVDDTLKELKKK